MKTLILFIASLAAVFSQGFRLNPITGQLDLVGGYVSPSGYSATITAQTTTTVTAASHGQGTSPVAYCFDNASPANAVSCAYTVSSIGDVVFTWSPAFTGTVIIRGPGADAGAAGNVVGPSSSTNAALACFSGTTGKVIAGCSALSTAGAVPYVASAGVLSQAATLSWDSTNNRLSLTGELRATTPSTKKTIYRSLGAQDAYTYWDEHQDLNGLWTWRFDTWGNPWLQNAYSLILSGPVTGGVPDQISHTHIKQTSVPSFASAMEINLTSGNGFTISHNNAAADSVIYALGLKNREDVPRFTFGLYPASIGARIGIGFDPGATPAGLLVSYFGIQANTNQAGYNLAEFRDSAGVARTYLDSSLRLVAKSLSVTDTTATVGASVLDVGWDGSATSPTTTQLRVRAGTTQGSTNLQTWQNSSGTTLSQINSSGQYGVIAGGALKSVVFSAISLASDSSLRFNSTVDLNGGAVDVSVSRFAAGVLEINNGTAGTLRDLLARQYKNTPVAVASLQTCNAGNAGSLASVNNALAPAWGVAVAGGGAAYASVTCNGTNWTVTGI